MHKKIIIEAENGLVLFSKDISSIDQEQRLKQKTKAKIIYNLLFLSQQYDSSDDAFDFIEFTDPSIYDKGSLVNHKTLDYIKDIFILSDVQRHTLLDIVAKFRALVIPNWWEEILLENNDWSNLLRRSRNLLNELKVNYEIDLDDYIEKHNI
jgi:hypothetical protein